MEVSYNLKYRKSSFSNRTLLNKEGEIIIYTKGFRLKGKGGSDKGELMNFSEIKEFYYRDEKIFFITFNKEKYTLSDVGTLFNQLLIDLYQSRNEFLMDALFMKSGKMKAEFDGSFQRLSKFGKSINKGSAKIRLYERSLVIIPPTSDVFAFNFNFINFHEFDDFEYQAKIVMDDGLQLFLMQMNNDFELFQEKFEGLLGLMYQDIIENVLRRAFPHFNAATLLKLAYTMKGGKTMSLYDIKKVDNDLSDKIEDFIYDDVLKNKVSVLRDRIDDHGVLYSIANDDTVTDGFIRWVLFAIPESNTVAFSILPRWKKEDSASEDSNENINSKEEHETYFYRIIIEKGIPAEKLEDKLKEINQALLSLNFIKDPCYKDKRDLKHSPYQYAIRKMPFLRILRKSYVGKAASSDVNEWQKQALECLAKCELKK